MNDAKKVAEMQHVFTKILEAAKDGQNGSATYALDRIRLIQTYAEIGIKLSI
jgi:hypothetical protein